MNTAQGEIICKDTNETFTNETFTNETFTNGNTWFRWFRCGKNGCPVNCSGNWNEWSICDRTNVNRTQTFNTTINAINNGLPCPKTRIKTDCPVDCSGNWSDSISCNLTTGLKSQIFTKKIDVSNNGLACPLDFTRIVNCSGIVSISDPNIPINVTSTGSKYIVFNYTTDNNGLTGQTSYKFTIDYPFNNASVLIVGGGGGGGGSNHYTGGGGGGGGDVFTGQITIPIGTHTIKVGKGGIGGIGGIEGGVGGYGEIIPVSGTSGYNSSLTLQTGEVYEYCGGGGGGNQHLKARAARVNTATNGGGISSGGGGAGGTQNGTGNSVSGNGGQTWGFWSKTAGGGGGSDNSSLGHGHDGNDRADNERKSKCGKGGNGTFSDIITSSVTVYGSGGGGGCSFGNAALYSNEITSGVIRNVPGNGGYIFGGGRGGTLFNEGAQNGANNSGTGGGGGGANQDANLRKGGDGGSGIIIIKYNEMIWE